jgi:hypothetical protein
VSSRVPEPCDATRGAHEGEVRFFANGWKCVAHRPQPRPLHSPDPVSVAPPHYRPSKLTPARRDEIRRRVGEGEPLTDLAAEFGVSVRTIRQNS